METLNLRIAMSRGAGLGQIVISISYLRKQMRRNSRQQRIKLPGIEPGEQILVIFTFKFSIHLSTNQKSKNLLPLPGIEPGPYG